MPYGPINVVRSGPVAKFFGITSGEPVPSMLLEVPDTLGEQGGGNEIKETCG